MCNNLHIKSQTSSQGGFFIGNGIVVYEKQLEYNLGYMQKNTDYLENLRHSTAHLLAAAVMDLWPKTKRTIGPSIGNGFYFDFDFSSIGRSSSGRGDFKITDADFPKIENKMREILPSWKGFEPHKLSAKDAKNEYPENPFKHELIDEFSENGKKQVSFYKSGSYWDLCRGGHVAHPDKELLYFKLLSVAGAYWKGSEKNPMLTRIYGTVFPTQKELDEYIKMQEEAKKRDHKKLGPAMELFLFHETAPGSPYWLPKGLIILNELLNFWRVEHAKRGYLETSTPLINKKSLWETSGHWDHYKDSMFIADMGENDVYGVKAMNCPNAMVIFGSKTRSYKDLPLRLSDSDVLHRYEKSGELNGLFRVRMFRQDDSHNFISEDQIETEYKEILDIAEQFYGIFNLDYKLRLGTRPEKYMGDKKSWDKAESTLRKILKKSGKEFFIMEGDGAFYGPKVDILMKDAIGREWQMGTIQLDFQQPRRFNLKYTDKDGSEKTPVVVHRVIYGSIERFIGILIENFAGNFPTWLTPVQVKVLPISTRHIKYAEEIVNKLKEEGIRVELDDRNATLPGKIRDAQNEKVPYMIIIGDKEEKAKKVAVRLRTEKDLGQKDLQELLKEIKANIENKSLEL